MRGRNQEVLQPLFARMKQWQKIFAGEEYTTKTLAALIANWSSDKSMLLELAAESNGIHTLTTQKFLDQAIRFFNVDQWIKLPTIFKGNLIVNDNVDVVFQENLEKIKEHKKRANDLFRTLENQEKNLQSLTLQQHHVFFMELLEYPQYKVKAQPYVEQYKMVLLAPFTNSVNKAIAALDVEQNRLTVLNKNDFRIGIVHDSRKYLNTLKNKTVDLPLADISSAIEKSKQAMLDNIDQNLINNPELKNHHRIWGTKFGRFLYNTLNLVSGHFLVQKAVTATVSGLRGSYGVDRGNFGFYTFKTNCTKNVESIRKDLENSFKNKK